MLVYISYLEEYINEGIYKRIDNILKVSLFIFLPQGRTGKGKLLITYTYDGETNHPL